jgi:hypothetical protein
MAIMLISHAGDRGAPAVAAIHARPTDLLEVDYAGMVELPPVPHRSGSPRGSGLAVTTTCASMAPSPALLGPPRRDHRPDPSGHRRADAPRWPTSAAPSSTGRSTPRASTAQPGRPARSVATPTGC